MHDPKFEKEVQQKMAELEFGPSESVWANVEAAINGRRRRRLGLFWRFGLPGLLLVAGGAFYFLRETPSKTAATAVAHPPAANDTRSNTNKTSSSTDNSTLSIDKIEPNGANATGTSTATNNATVADHPTTLARRRSGTSPIHSPVHFKAAVQNANGHYANGENATGEKMTDQKVTDQKMTDQKVTDQKVAGEKVTDQMVERIEDAGLRNFAFNPALASLYPGLSPVRAGKLESKATTRTIQTLSKQHNPWEAGFAGGAGLSTLHQMKLANYSLLQSDLPASLTAANAITTYAARPTKEYVSTVDPGPAFWFGIVAQKRLGARWNFSAGLDFHYYSNRLHVGQQVSGYTPSSATYLNAQAVAPIQSYPYYSRGDDQSFMNRYYFLELPVAIEWRINRSHLLPLYLDGGVSASYLVGSSAVYYNTHSGVYFKDAGVANRAQLNLNTALMVGLPMQKIHILVGPQIQYGLTPLLNTDVSGPQHIFYGGIRLVVMPGKK